MEDGRFPATDVPDVADRFRQPALDHTQCIRHLQGSILRRRVAQSVEGALVRLRKHVRDAPRIAKDLEPLLRRNQQELFEKG